MTLRISLPLLYSVQYAYLFKVLIFIIVVVIVFVVVVILFALFVLCVVCPLLFV
jgi:hypothetical protein